MRSPATTCLSTTMPAVCDSHARGACGSAWLRTTFFEGLDPQIRQSVDRAVSVFAKLGAEIHQVALPESTQRPVLQAEVYAYHAAHMAATPELYLPETLSKLRLGANIDMPTYIKAKLSLDQLRRTAPTVFRNTDAVLTPTTPVPPPRRANCRRRSTTSWHMMPCCSATRGRSTCWLFPQFRSRAGSQTWVCRSVYNSAEHHGRSCSFLR